MIGLASWQCSQGRSVQRATRGSDAGNDVCVDRFVVVAHGSDKIWSSSLHDVSLYFRSPTYVVASVADRVQHH